MDKNALREAMKAKAHRMAGGDDAVNVDASSWRPSEKLKATVQTGERPVSARAYKNGGAVPGGASVQTGGRKARKDGGKAITADSYQNRDMKEANEKRDGEKHVGGYATGGEVVKKADKIMSAAEAMVKGKGEMYQPKKSAAEEMVKRPGRANGGSTLKPDAPLKMAGTLKADAPLPDVIPLQDQVTQAAGRKAGGKVKKANGGMAMDTPLPRTKPLPRTGSLQDQVTAQAMKQRATGAPLPDSDADTDPMYGARKAGGRANLKMDDKDDGATKMDEPPAGHPQGCDCKRCSGGKVMRKAGGSVLKDADGDISPNKGGKASAGAMKKKMTSQTDTYGGRMGRKSGGRTQVNIVISTGKKEEEKPQMLPPMPPAPPIVPPGAGAPPPMAMPPRAPMGAPGPMPGPGMPPPGMMARKDGGKVYPIDGGSGGAKARLEKKGAYGLKMNKDLNK